MVICPKLHFNYGNSSGRGIEWIEKVDGKYVTDFIRAMTTSDEMQFNIVDQQKPMILEDKGDENYKYVVRPLIIN